MLDPLKEHNTDQPASAFYDIIIKSDSFRHLKKEPNTENYGWNVVIRDGFKYENAIKKELVIVSVIGNRNKGKSYMLSKLANIQLPCGTSVRTEGISAKYPEIDNTSLLVLDSAGFETALVETEDFKLSNKIDPTTAEEMKNEIARDRSVVELFTQKFVLSNSDVIIAVVSQLTFTEQQLLIRIKKEQLKGNKKLLVLHNLYNFTTKQQVEDHIKNILLKSQTFSLEEKHYIRFDTTEKSLNENDIYYHENENGKSIEHLIFARDDTEAGKYYNESSKRFLRELVTSTTNTNKIDLVKKMQLFLRGMSKDIFENEISKDYIKFDNNKIYIDENYPTPIVLKKIQVDSLSVASFYGKAYQPNYEYYVLPKEEAPEAVRNKITQMGDEVAGREKVFVLIIDIPALKKTKKGTIPIPHIDIDDGITYVTLKGKRTVQKVRRENQIAQNGGGIIEGDFKMNLVIFPDDIFLNTSVLIDHSYERGVLTYYYAYHDLHSDKGEDLN